MAGIPKERVRRKKRDNAVYLSMRPLFLFCTVPAFILVDRNESKKPRRRKLRGFCASSRFLRAQNVSILLTYGLGEVATVINLYYAVSAGQSLTRTIHYIWPVIDMLLLLATSTSLILHRGRIDDVLFRTNEVFRKIRGTSISRRSLETFVWAHCIVLWSILILGCSHILVRKLNARMLGSILQFLSHVTVTAISLQFSILLRVVLLSLRDLNAQISIVFRRFLEQSEMRKPPKATLTSEVPGTIAARRLRHLARQHLAMCGVARDLNAIYGVNALVHSTQILMDLAYHSFIMAELIGGIAHGFRTSHYLVDLFIWNVPTLSSLAHSVMQCQAASLEIRRFSNQIHHSQAKFSGAGFVSLDYSLFVKIAAAAFSNVIILAQFQSYVVPAK